MNWLTFVAGAVLSWGVYGAMLHQGQTKLGSPMRALLCVGIAYCLIGVLVPVVTMMSQGQLDSRGWNTSGATFATVAGALGGHRRRLHHLFVPCGRPSHLCHAARVRRRAARQRPVHDGGASTEDDTESPALCRVSRDRHWGGNGVVLQAGGLKEGKREKGKGRTGKKRSLLPTRSNCKEMLRGADEDLTL